MKSTFSPKQVASALGVSEASLKRWCDKGLLSARRTAGGHRRIPIASVVQFVRSSGHPIVDPDSLCLPGNSGIEPATDAILADVVSALSGGDEQGFRRLILSRFLQNTPASHISDELIAAAFNKLGDRWQHGRIEIYQERRACEMCLRLLHELVGLVPPLSGDAPRAIGATLSGDLYMLPTKMVEWVLRDRGWKARSFGTNLPVETLIAAIKSERPGLVWISVSHTESHAVLREQLAWLQSTCREQGIQLAVGGRVFTGDLPEDLKATNCFQSLTELEAFVLQLHPQNN